MMEIMTSFRAILCCLLIAVGLEMIGAAVYWLIVDGMSGLSL